MTSGNYFRDYLLLTEDKLMTKMDHYLDVYHRLLAPWRSQDISFLEIGVWKGGSIKMWQDYFGAASRLTFLDIDPACKTFEVPGIAVEIGDQSDCVFLKNLLLHMALLVSSLMMVVTRCISKKQVLTRCGRSFLMGASMLSRTPTAVIGRALAGAFGPRKALSSFQRIW